MKSFAFVSRHEPTRRQVELADEHRIDLVHVGDMDAFKIHIRDLSNHEEGPFDGAVVVHPAAALRLCKALPIGIFENANRAPAGERPQFEAKALYIYDLTEEWL